MRKIKFRVWAKMAQEMAMLDYEDIKDWSLEDLNDDEDIVMQYTGLKDVNGKEIYEGDIIKTTYAVAPVEFKKGGFECDWGRDHLNTMLGFWVGSDFNGKIIGNRYENPELLETKK